MHAVHTDKVEAAATLPYVPATHEVHTEDVLAVAMLLYLPAEHAVHTGPAVPISPPSLYLPAGQDTQPTDPATLP